MGRIRFLVGAVVLMTVAPPSVAASAAVPNYYSTPYSSTVLYHRTGSTDIAELSDIAWLYSGKPTPTPAPTSVVQLAGSGDLYAVSVLGGDAAYWHLLSYDEWRDSGFPPPTSGRDINQSFDVRRYVRSPEIFLSAFPIGTWKMSYETWSSMGAPIPEVIPVVVANLSWAPERVGEIFPSGPAQYSTWSLSYVEWAARGFPTPVALPSFPNDIVCSTNGSSNLRYVGRTYDGPLTYAQWSATNFLPPVVCG